MPKKYYPVKKSSNRRYPVQRATNPIAIKGGVPNIFGDTRTLKHEVAKGRIHCVAIQRTAIYKDANGNKIVLKENQTTMNTPETHRGELRFDDGYKGRWNKR